MKPLAGLSADKIVAAGRRLQERRPARDDHAPDRQGLHRRADPLIAAYFAAQPAARK
jgi:hypothetical protein